MPFEIFFFNGLEAFASELFIYSLMFKMFSLKNINYILYIQNEKENAYILYTINNT